MTKQRCITGVDPLERCTRPSQSEFGDADFLPAPSIRTIAEALIYDVREFDLLRAMIDSCRVSVEYVWRKKAAKKGHKIVFGKCTKASGYARYFSQAEFVIEIAADATVLFTNFQLEALVYHELKHVGVDLEEDEDGNETLVLAATPHDVEMFNGEVVRYGLWQADLARSAEAFSQAPLWERNGRTAWSPKDNDAATPPDRVANLRATGGEFSTADGREIRTDAELRDHLRSTLTGAVGRIAAEPDPDDDADDLPSDLLEGEEDPEQPPTILTLEPKVPVKKGELLAIATDPVKAGGAEMVQFIHSGCDGVAGDTVQISTSLADRWGLTPVHA